MKKYLFGLLVAVLAATALFSFKPSIAEKQEEMLLEKTPDFEMFYAPSGTYYEVTFTKDTITNAGADTIYLPSSLRPVLSDFQMGVGVTRTSLTGTHNVAVKVQESVYRYSGTTPPTAGWVATLNSANAAAATAATTATTEGFFIPHCYGLSYRLIVTGSGTQTSSYVLRLILKKKT